MKNQSKKNKGNNMSCKLEAMFNLRKEFIDRLEKEIPESFVEILH